MRTLRSTALAFAAIITLAHGPALAVPLFSADFNSGDVSGWLLSTNYSGAAGIESVPSSAYPSLTLDGTNSLGVFVKAPPPTSSSALFASANKTIFLSEPSTHLSFQALSLSCTGCTISWFVRLDGVPIASNASNGLVDNISLNWAFAAGNHTLTLGMNTTQAFSGQFEAVFDNILISNDRASEVPLPAALPLFVGALGMLGVLALRRNRSRRAL